MRKQLVIILTLLAFSIVVHAQTNTIYGKDVVISTRDTSSAELTIKNSTRTVQGFLKNASGTGKTMFTFPTWSEIASKPSNFNTTYALSNDVKDSILKRISWSDTGRNTSQIVTGGSFKKVLDSTTEAIGLIYKPANDSLYNTGFTSRWKTKDLIDSLGNIITNGYVDLTNAQTIAGLKSFTNYIRTVTSGSTGLQAYNSDRGYFIGMIAGSSDSLFVINYDSGYSQAKKRIFEAKKTGEVTFKKSVEITNNTTILTPLTGTVLHIQSADATLPRFGIDAMGNQGNIYFRRSNGTAASPTALLIGDAISNITALGHDGTTLGTSARANHIIQAAENWTPTAQGTAQRWATTPIGSTSNTTVMFLGDDGSLSLGGTKGTGTGNFYANLVNLSSRLNVNGATDNAAKSLNVNGVFGLASLNTAPSSASDTGVLGEIRWDANYMYVCVATNTWKRSAITTW